MSRDEKVSKPATQHGPDAAFAEHDDVPAGVDFLDPDHCRAWTDASIVKKPYRPQFFAAICDSLHDIPRPRVLELGSGPGRLAREILIRCAPREYVALDFSTTMHELAREYLGELASAVQFETRNFRSPSWPDGLGFFDAIVTMQAVHETRNVRHHLALFERAHSLLPPGGRLLYCDGFMRPGANPALTMDRDEQPRVLERAGFTDVTRLLEHETLVLYSATAQ
jgi:cyclopropane fatty-acyl-phospholipid synthase-like methyltransferase